MTAFRRVLFAAVIGLPLGSCDDQGAKDYQPTYAIKSAAPDKSYRVGCPFNTPETLFKIYQPLIDYLNARLGGPKLALEASRDYEAFEQKLYYRNFDFALSNPYQTVMAVTNGFQIFAKMAPDDQSYGMILVRKDSPVAQVADLKGQAIAHPATSALAATMLPQDFLHENGLNVERDLETRYVGSEESSILSVYLGRAAAGTTWPLAWTRFAQEDPAKAAELVVKWRTRTLPNNAWVARDDVPKEVVDKVGRLLAGMDEDPEGRKVLAHMLVERFEAAGDADYLPVHEFLRRFNDNVRPVALP